MACIVKDCPFPFDVGNPVVLLVDGDRLSAEACDTHQSMYANITPNIFGQRFIGAIQVNPPEEAAVSAVPTMFESDAGVDIEQTVTQIPLTESVEFPIHSDLFELVDGGIKVLKAGRYRVDAYAEATVGGAGPAAVAGVARFTAIVSVNDQSKGPAWAITPPVMFDVSNVGIKAASSWSFPQDLEVDDVITLEAMYAPWGTADLGDLTLNVSSASSFITLTEM